MVFVVAFMLGRVAKQGLCIFGTLFTWGAIKRGQQDEESSIKMVGTCGIGGNSYGRQSYAHCRNFF